MDSRLRIDSLNEQLFDAIKKNIPLKIEKLIKDGAELFAIKDKKNPIELAVDLEHWKCVDAILAAAPVMNSKDTNRYGSALLSAIKADRRTTAETLLKAGASTTWYSTDDENYSLHWAIKNHNIAIIAPLIKAGASITQPNKANQTPMQMAVSLEYWDCVLEIIIEAGDDLDEVGSVLIEAIKANRDQIVELLLKKNVSTGWHTQNDNNYALHWAVKKYNNYILTLLINHKANLAQTNKANMTPIHLAANLGNWSSIETIAKAVSTDDKDTYHYGEALLAAIQKNQIKTAEILLKAKTPATSEEHRYLHEAVSASTPEMVKLLLRYGAKISQTNRIGETAFEVACSSRKWAHAETLIQDKNFKINDRVNMGTAFNHAIAAGQLEIAEALYKEGVSTTHKTKESGNSSLHWAVLEWSKLKNNAQTISYVMTRSGNEIAVAVNVDDETPIELACRLGLSDCAQLLIEHEKKSSAYPDFSRINALHYEKALLHAIRHGDYPIVKSLLEQHTPCNKANSEMGNIALHLALTNNKNNRQMIALLLEHGADPMVLNNNEKTTIDLAKHLKHPCLDLLKEYQRQRLRENTKQGSTKFNPKNSTPSSRMEENRDQANRLYQSMCDNNCAAEEMPVMTDRLVKCHLAMLESIKLKLVDQRENLKKETTNYLNQIVNEKTELGSLNLLIQTINTLLKYPQQPVAINLLQALNSVEAKDVLDIIERKNRLRHYYQNKVKNFLYDLNNKIKATHFKVTNFLGMYVDGIPDHVQELKKHLAKLPELQTEEITAVKIKSIYAEVVKILAHIQKSTSRRHPTTKSFYKYAKKGAKSLNFAEPLDFTMNNLSYPIPNLSQEVFQTFVRVNPLTPHETLYNITSDQNSPLIQHHHLYPSLNTGIVAPSNSLNNSPPSYKEYLSMTNKYQDPNMVVVTPPPVYVIPPMNMVQELNISPPSFDSKPSAIQPIAISPNELSTTVFNDMFPPVPENTLPKLSIYSQPSAPLITTKNTEEKRRELVLAN